MYSGTGVWAGHAHWQSTTWWKYSGLPMSVGFTLASSRRAAGAASREESSWKTGLLGLVGAAGEDEVVVLLPEHLLGLDLLRHRVEELEVLPAAVLRLGGLEALLDVVFPGRVTQVHHVLADHLRVDVRDRRAVH